MDDPVRARITPAVRHPSRSARALASAAVAAATVAGMLIGIGRRTGMPMRPLNALAHAAIGARADQVWSFAPNVTPVGVGVVLVVSAVAGIAAAWLSSFSRRMHDVGAALCVALAGYLVHRHLFSRAPDGLAAVLSLGELRALYASAGIGLACGMRFAFPPRDDGEVRAAGPWTGRADGAREGSRRDDATQDAGS